MNKFHIIFGIILFCIAVLLYAKTHPLESPQKEITFHKMSTGNYFLKEDAASLLCELYVDSKNRNVFIRPGNSTIRSYKEQEGIDACADTPKQISWIVTTARKPDNFEVQCRISVMTDRINKLWSTQVKVEPYNADDDNLCATLIKSANCVVRSTNRPDQYLLNCLNKFVQGRFREIEVTLEGTDFDISETQLNNPFDFASSANSATGKPYHACRFKFCRIKKTDTTL